ncbi:MAG: metallophosphoesterase [Deltaproteobacteria bacterium]|nr:metallophosphoesterase [Deltaproteobacteria bacterium]
MKTLGISLCVLGGVLWAACGGGDGAVDAGPGVDASAAPDGGAADAGADSGFDAGWPPVARPPTTVKVTLSPRLPLEKQDESLSDDFGEYSMNGPGEPHILRDDLGTAGHRSGTPAPKSVLYIGHTSDNHVVDFQSPARVVRLDNPKNAGAYRPQEGFAIALFDQMLKTFNAFSYFRKLDALVLTGDGIDNNHYNEVRLFVDALDGKTVDPNTGGYPFSGDFNMCSPVSARGIDPAVPWFYVIGNHDILMQGNFEVVSRALTPDEQEVQISESGFYKTAVGDKSDTVIECQEGPLNPMDLKSGVVTPNPDRRFLTHRQMIEEFFVTTGLPSGHGFMQSSIDADLGVYTADLGEGAPVRLVAFETAHPEANDEGYVLRTVVDGFLKPELERAKNDGVLVVVASHHPSWAIVEKSEVRSDELVGLLASYPNVILHLVGHGHSNTVTPHPSGNADGTGYWEVEATSTIDFPQQAHLVEIVDDGDGTGSVYVTVINHDAPEGSVAWRARALSILDIQTGADPDPDTGGVSDRNVILKFLVADAAKPKLAAIPAREVETLNY